MPDNSLFIVVLALTGIVGPVAVEYYQLRRISWFELCVCVGIQVMYGYIFATGNTLVKIVSTIVWITAYAFAMIGWFTQISNEARAREDAKKQQ